LISYSLAGSEAYASLFGVGHVYLISPFVIVLTLVIVFGSLLLQPVISFLTFGKGAVLILMVAATAVVGIQAGNPIDNNWKYVGKPFLIGTVALGGAVNILPITFAKIQPNKQDIIKYLRAIIGGLFTVWVLNVLWCFYILRIVPQTADGGPINLQNSNDEGEIATVPLIEIIRGRYPEFNWIASLVDIFITISITVSFVTMGTGTKHVLDGFTSTNEESSVSSENVFDEVEQTSTTAQTLLFKVRSLRLAWKKAILYSLCFGIVLILAQSNPRGFIVIMERVTSLALNLEAGAFVAVMVGRSKAFHMSIPLPLNKHLFNARWLVLAYFVFAILYDCVAISLGVFGIHVL